MSSAKRPYEVITLNSSSIDYNVNEIEDRQEVDSHMDVEHYVRIEQQNDQEAEEENFRRKKLNIDKDDVLESIFRITIVTVQTISNPLSQSKSARLNLTDNLSTIRDQLEMDNIIDNTLSFSKKYGGGDKFAEIALENEKDFFLNEIIDERFILYLIKSSQDTSARGLSQDSISMVESDTTEITVNLITQQMIQQLKLNHGIFLDGYNIRPSKEAIFVKNGELTISLYKGQPIVYTDINDPDSSVNLLNFKIDEDNFNNDLQQYNVCISFPIAEIIYKGDLLESFSNYMDCDDKLHELYGHFFARKISVGGKLFIKEFNSASQTQIDILKSYLLYVYNLANCSAEIQFDNLFLFPLDLLPRIETLNGVKLNTFKKLANWMNNLYQKNLFYIISYDDLIPVSQLETQLLLLADYGVNLIEKQPGIANFKGKLSLENWIENASYVNLARLIHDLHIFQCLIINNYYKIEVSKKIAFNFVKIPTIKSSNNSYLEVIKPRTNIEEFLILNNIFSIKNLNEFPFVNGIINSDVLSYGGYGGYKLLVKFEQCEILINKDHIKPTIEFEQAIEIALKSMKPIKALQDVFDEYGHLFPQKIILGRFFKRNIPNTSLSTSDKIYLNPPVYKSLKPYLDKENISYLLKQKGNIIEENELSDVIQNLNNYNDWEIIEFDSIISLHSILEAEQQREIENIFNNSKIIMTGIVDLDDLDKNNDEHYKRINVHPSLEDDNYQVFGSIITKNNSRSKDFFVTFGLHDFNGFSAMIKASRCTNINITECCILWMIVGNPSKLSVFSPMNRELQVGCIKELNISQSDISYYQIRTKHQLFQGYISINAYYSTNYEPIDIEIVGCLDDCINVSTSLPDFLANVEKIDIHICILSSDYTSLKIDNKGEEYHLSLIGYEINNYESSFPFETSIAETTHHRNSIEDEINNYESSSSPLSSPFETSDIYNEIEILNQEFITNGILSLPLLNMTPLEIYENLLIYNNKSKVKPLTMRNLLRFFVSKLANQIQITNPIVISNVTDSLIKVATPQVKHGYYHLAEQVNEIIKHRKLYP